VAITDNQENFLVGLSILFLKLNFTNKLNSLLSKINYCLPKVNILSSKNLHSCEKIQDQISFLAMQKHTPSIID